MDSIPKELVSNYIIHNETMKYATFDDEEFEKNITDENITEQTLIDNLNKLEATIDTLIDKFSFLIKTNKLGINEYLTKFDMATLEYIIIPKCFKLIIKELRIKLNTNTQEKNDELNLEKILSEYKNGEYKTNFEKQFTENSEKYNELKKRIEDIFSYVEKIRNSKEKIGLIHLNLMIRYINIYTNKIINQLNVINDFEKMKSSSENQILTALVLIKRVLTFPFSLFNSFSLSSEDICNIPEKSEEWDRIKKFTFRVNSKDDDKIKQLLKDGNESQSYILSVFYDSFTQKNTVKKVFTAINQGIHLKLSKEARDIHFKKARLNLRPQLLMDVLKMQKNKLLKKLMIQTYPSVTFRRKLYLKKEYK